MVGSTPNRMWPNLGIERPDLTQSTNNPVGTIQLRFTFFLRKTTPFAVTHGFFFDVSSHTNTHTHALEIASRVVNELFFGFFRKRIVLLGRAILPLPQQIPITSGAVSGLQSSGTPPWEAVFSLTRKHTTTCTQPHTPSYCSLIRSLGAGNSPR